MITRIHHNPEENHKDACLLLSTVMNQQRETHLKAMEKGKGKEKSLQNNLELH